MMKKSILTASVIGAISAVISGVAVADTGATSTYCKPGFYAGIQGGRSDTFYNPSNVLNQAANNENYLAGAGSTTTTTTINGVTTASTSNSENSSSLKNQDVDDIGIGGRVFAGYQFNPYFATELGYTQYGKTDFSANGVQVSPNSTYTVCDANCNQTTYVGTQTSTDKYSGNVTEHAVDLVGKGTMPLPYGFGVYAKAGMAYITADRSINATYGVSNSFYSNDGTFQQTTTSSGQAISNIYSKTYQAFRPTYGVGVDYTIPNTPVDVDLSWTRVQGASAIPNADLWAIGAAYKFA